MRHRRYRAIALLLGTFVLGCDAAPMETSDKAANSNPPPQAAVAAKPAGSRSARSGRAKPTPKTVAPLPTQGYVD
jgi:hypothetical protein